MHIVCSRCIAEYDLDDDKLIGKRLLVRCPKCKNTFWVKGHDASAADAPEDGPEPAEAGSAEAPGSGDPFPPAAVQDEGSSPFDEEEPSLEALPESSDTGSEAAETGGSYDLPDKLVTEETPGTPTEELKHFFERASSGMAHRFSSNIEYDEVGRGIARKLLSVLFVGVIVAVFLIPPLQKPLTAAIADISWTLQEYFFPSNPLAIEKIRSRFVRDNQDSILFVVEGQVRNRSKSPVVCPMMIGKLFGAGGVVIQQSSTYCGRRLRTEELRTFGATRIREMFEPSTGGKATSKVQPGYSIPFMVVFYNSPEDAMEFEIEVIANSVSGELAYHLPEKI